MKIAKEFAECEMLPKLICNSLALPERNDFVDILIKLI